MKRMSRSRWTWIADVAPEVPLAAYALLANLLWELGQTPFYMDGANRPEYILWTRLHCTADDVLIVLGAFWLTSLARGARDWWRAPRATGLALFVGAGLSSTIFSEWYNTTVRQAWAYAPGMPTVLGIGLTSALQWILIPPAVLLWLQRTSTDRS